ncbi:lactoylglutathione lyase [Alkalicaulis satelles]|uniref:Lactoylglutathione lyase n=1 Tax=Alkalicaulis satelles TaxID=2609175 RepID=A0A5M6ZNJ5_9PROT|nr:VOC family protein [Alkalicaulis satelles]KAA5803801.1 lactoylglutathione lyase [Alkalicaulis satelles]
MEYLHAMVRISDVDASLRFFCEGLGLKEVRRKSSEKGRFTLIFLAAPDDLRRAGIEALDEGPLPAGLPMIELTHNWDPEDYGGARNFGHLAFRVADIYALCARLQALGYVIHRPPRDGHMAFVRSPDGISIELLQRGEHLAPAEPWASMDNTGSW